MARKSLKVNTSMPMNAIEGVSAAHVSNNAGVYGVFSPKGDGLIVNSRIISFGNGDGFYITNGEMNSYREGEWVANNFKLLSEQIEVKFMPILGK